MILSVVEDGRQDYRNDWCSNVYNKSVVLVAMEFDMIYFFHIYTVVNLKASITTAADDIHKYFFIVFQRK